MTRLQRFFIGVFFFSFGFFIWGLIVLSGPGQERNLFLDIKPFFFEPEVTEDFEGNEKAIPKIPHILHQTYKDEFVPESSVRFIQSLIKYNPNWTYFFWTDKTARKFLEDKYEFFVPIWDGYKENVYRADALRYFVLHEYGGVYVDIDVECLRPLDRATTRYPAIFPLEPFEHSVFRLQLPFLVNNAIMMTKPKHPFLERMLHKLSEHKNGKWIIDVAGPLFVNNVFKEYYNISEEDEKHLIFEEISQPQEPYFYKRLKQVNKDDTVYIPNTHFFMNTLAENFDVENWRIICKRWVKSGHVYCRKSYNHPMCRLPNELEKRACNELYRRDNRTREDHFRFTFTKHHWFSTYFKTKIRLNNTVDIRTVVPNVKFYN